jgi:hypothetical protein
MRLKKIIAFPGIAAMHAILSMRYCEYRANKRRMKGYGIGIYEITRWIFFPVICPMVFAIFIGALLGSRTCEEFFFVITINPMKFIRVLKIKIKKRIREILARWSAEYP